MADEKLEQQEQEPKKKGGKLKWIIILVLILAIGGAGFFFKDMILGMLGMGGEPPAQEEPAPDAQAELPPGTTGPMVAVAPFVANLQDPLGKRYIKLAMQVELRDEEAVAEFNAADVKIKDMLIRLLGGMRPQDMLGQQNQLEFKQEVVNRLNQIIGPGRVLNIYFSEFILQ